MYLKVLLNKQENQPEDQWSFKRSPEYWPGVNTKNETNCHSNQFVSEQNKNTTYVEDNVINTHEKFQLHPPYGVWGEDYFTCFLKFTLFVALATK